MIAKESPDLFREAAQRLALNWLSGKGQKLKQTSLFTLPPSLVQRDDTIGSNPAFYAFVALFSKTRGFNNIPSCVEFKGSNQALIARSIGNRKLVVIPVKGWS